MKIILDFDDTIFDTHQMVDEFVKISEKAGFTKNEFWTAYQGCKEKAGDFDAEIITDLLCRNSTALSLISKKEEIIKEINSVLSKTNDFVYPDFFDFVGDFDKKDLILLSFGTSDFHKTKIKNSKVGKFFDEIIITTGDKVEELKIICGNHRKDKIFFIDDKAEQIDRVKVELPQIIVMKMTRPQGGRGDTESQLADCVVENLNEAKEMIFRINKQM
jgi:phosphoglycolate phosphatase-like HAD superfamily hydrolase